MFLKYFAELSGIKNMFYLLIMNMHHFKNASRIKTLSKIS